MQNENEVALNGTLTITLPEGVCTELLEQQRTYPIKIPVSPYNKVFKL